MDLNPVVVLMRRLNQAVVLMRDLNPVVVLMMRGQWRSKKCDDYRLSILFIFCAQIYHPEVKFESKRQATMVHWIR